MREGKIPPNLIDLVQHSLQIGAPEIIYLKDTRFAPDIEEDPNETPDYDPGVALDNNNKTITLTHSEPHVQEILAREGAPVSEVIGRSDSKGVQNT